MQMNNPCFSIATTLPSLINSITYNKNVKD